MFTLVVYVDVNIKQNECCFQVIFVICLFSGSVEDILFVQRLECPLLFLLVSVCEMVLLRV